MDKDRLKNQLKIMVQVEVGMESDLKRLDLLELEILAIKTHIQSHRKILRPAICSIIGMIEGEDCANWDFGFDEYSQSITTSLLNQESNEFQKIVSPKSVKNERT